MSDTCATCRFSQPSGNLNRLECHRHAPRLLLLADQSSNDWAVVSRTDWCGEHEPKRDAVREVVAAELFERATKATAQLVEADQDVARLRARVEVLERVLKAVIRHLDEDVSDADEQELRAALEAAKEQA